MRDQKPRPELRVDNRLDDDTCRRIYRLRDRLPRRHPEQDDG